MYGVIAVSLHAADSPVHIQSDVPVSPLRRTCTQTEPSERSPPLCTLSAPEQLSHQPRVSRILFRCQSTLAEQMKGRLAYQGQWEGQSQRRAERDTTARKAAKLAYDGRPERIAYIRQRRADFKEKPLAARDNEEWLGAAIRASEETQTENEKKPWRRFAKVGSRRWQHG